ncbi:crotonase/enoyl-CoA hydratase family protein [Aldersonia sp. NBC_00410]|uniref:crotonase/enoyl-CoA hydratase family protein n=1 Tax=Aldersonia sp. NBC_00410 TaxID=2975954 RepID=UPI0022539828|nr:crotonase/enoyl-CoA hydratase family protein [Aldersonia sp. NBC_00410]MCX5041872.1 crotonase/enoyl-CoA hydratase family protein [Aldersonia sp. NBC_00410]
MGNDTVLATTNGHVATWTLNLPEQRNPISDQSVVERIEELVAAANDDVDIRVVIITGAGKGFSSGGNVKHMVDRVGIFGGAPHEQRNGYRKGIQRIPRALYHLEVPLIAAVNGAAIGAGCDLALMADMRIASEKAVFAESFVKLGIIPGDGGAWLLPRAVGNARAAEMAFTGDPIDAATALDWGLVSRVVAPEQLLDEAMTLAQRVAVNPPTAVRMTKKLLREGQHMTLESLLELSAAMQPLAHHTQDHREALAGFTEKRPTNYTGA